MKSTSGLKLKTAEGLFWSFLELLSVQGIRLISQIVLARLLLPEDFGIIAMIIVFISLSQAVIDSGFSNALIRERDATQKDYSTVFFFNIFMSCLMYSIIFILAGPISIFFNEPKLIIVLRILSLGLIISSFSLCQKVMLTKRVDFKTQTMVTVASALISGGVSIYLAFAGFGVWSLVIQTLLLHLVQAVLYWVSNKWVPSPVFAFTSLKKFFGFSWKLTVESLLSILHDNVYYFIIGRVFSALELGYYSNAKKIKDIASHSITTSIQKVSYPVLSSIQESDDRLLSGYRQIIKNTVYIIYPAMIGLAAVAPNLIRVLLGQNWVPSVPYFQLLCVSGLFYPLNAINMNILKVKGRSDLSLVLSVIKVTLSLVSVAIVIFMRLGITGLLWVTVFNSLMAYLINSVFSGRLISYPILKQFTDIVRTVIIAAIMGAVVALTGLILPERHFIMLLVQIITGTAIYILLSILFRSGELYFIKEIVNGFIVKFRASIPRRRND